ncbi:MAG: zinc ribbon domain-containing protein [Clostridia bacterium]|nr:zinc ribbon domain-containing protein [Clostridia bacterium]
MKHIKPGRGPSMMSGVMCIATAVFGVIWTALAASMGAGPFALFGIVFIAVSVINAVYNFKNASQKNRYSLYDITSSEVEPDPLNVRFGEAERSNGSIDDPKTAPTAAFCPYCGAALQEDFVFCNRCGKKQP